MPLLLPSMSYALSLLWTLVASVAGFAALSASPTGARQGKPALGGQPKIKRTLREDAGSIGCQLQDKAGNIWFSTAGSGVFRFEGSAFVNFTTADGLCDNGVGSIIEDRRGNILIATGKGICQFNASGGKKGTFTKRTELGDHKVTCLREDRDGNLWFATMTSGVYRHDAKTGELTNFLNNQRFNLSDRYQLILDIHQDRSGNMWFTSWNGGGAWRLGTDGKTFRQFLPSADYYQVKGGFSEDGRAGVPAPQDAPYESRTMTIGDDMVFSMSEDRAGNLWFALRSHGACKYDPVKDEFTHFRRKEGMHSRGTYSILEDRNGSIWFTTEASGVWRYDAKTGGFRNFTTKDGLVNNSVFTVLEDRDGNLWFGTRQFGLSRYDGTVFTTFSE